MSDFTHPTLGGASNLALLTLPTQTHNMVMNASSTQGRQMTRVARLATVVRCANQMLDRRVQPPFTFEDVYEAADDGGVLDLLRQIDDHDLLASWMADPLVRREMEAMLHAAAHAMEGREMTVAGIGDNALCLLIAMAVEAMRHPEW